MKRQRQQVKISIAQLRAEAASGRYLSINSLARAFGTAHGTMKSLCTIHDIVPKGSQRTTTTK